MEVSENLGMKVDMEKTEIQYMGIGHKNFNIVINNQNLKQSTLFICEGTSVQIRESYLIIYICIQTNNIYMHIEQCIHT